MANYNIVEKVEMCSDDCCGKPITECVCGPDCEHCDCHAKNNIDESYSDDFQYSDDDDGNRTVSNCCGADAYIRHNEISVGDTGRCSDCREMAEFIPEKDFFESTVSEEDVTVDNAGNIAGYLDTIDDYVEQVFMIDDQTRAEDIKEMAHRIQNAVDDIRIRELKIQPSNLRQNFESSNLGEDEVTRIKELAGIFKSSVEESKELDEIAPLVPPNEETVNEEHDIGILKAVAQQMEADAHTGDFTAIEELLQDIPQENLEAFLTDHRSKNEYPEENIQPAVETVEQNKEEGNE